MSNISKDFSGVKVLDDVSFDLNRGEVHVLAGENGAGKSTLMKILSGVHADYSGSISLDGGVVSFSSPHDAGRQGVAIIHQELSLVHSMSVADNLFLGRESAAGSVWLNRKAQEAESQRILRRLNLDIDVQKQVSDFPPSVCQLIEIARALAMNAKVLIMDEPTSSLNEAEAQRLFALISEIKQTCGVIYISHKMDEIFQLADRITVLRDGSHIITDDAKNISQGELVKKLVGRELNEQYPPRNENAGEVALAVVDVSINQAHNSALTGVKNVSLTVHAGEIVGLAGVQGSGNSELLHGLFGSYGGIVRGRVSVGAKPYTPRTPAHAVKAGVALLTNDRKRDGLVSGMSVAHNMSLASLKSLYPDGWVRDRREQDMASKYKRDFDISMASADQDVRELSGGNQQKVVLAKWMETGPRILLLDEPTRGVDVGAKHEIYKWMNRWKTEGVAILLITSELSELLAIADRIYVMQRGEINAEYSASEATRENVIQAAMV